MSDVFVLSYIHREVDLHTPEISQIDLVLSKLAEQVIAIAIAQAGVAAYRIESLIWGGMSLPQNRDIPWVQVIRPGLSALQSVFFASEAILCGEVQAVAAGGGGHFLPDQSYFESIIQQLLGGSHPDPKEIAHSHDNIRSAAGTAAIILASTGIIGSLNLSPPARIAALSQGRLGKHAIRDEFEYVMEKILLKAGLSLQDISLFSMDAIWGGVVSTWLQASNVEPGRIVHENQNQQLSHTGEAQGAILLCQLIQALEHKDKKWGLILQVGLDFSLLAVLIEHL